MYLTMALPSFLSRLYQNDGIGGELISLMAISKIHMAAFICLNLLCGVSFLMNWCLIYLYVFNGLFYFLFKKYSFRNAW
ncbi:TPA: hypothetical protein JD362_11110 [Citrobacter freundii]|nr:hypothetical protein AB180_17610 [Citrobacter freundii]POU20331.1 hypothetical protein C3391_16800 [Citrobacter freundii complex sp. CFNIH8]QAR63200.1 hypothetical protein C3B53_00555 [Citrobacter sp. SL156]QBI28225.1 hypothetical protein WN16_03030 [Citrobacter sp. ABFQG]AKL57405.1 hypothetical protein AB183_16315 [Citrobacter freundii]